MKQNNVTKKFAEQAQHALANIVLFDMSDPALADVVITGAEISVDKRFMRVFISTDPAHYDRALKALDRARGFIRSELAKQLEWRVMPDLSFEIDKTTDMAEAINKALQNKPPSILLQNEEASDKANDE